MKHLIIILGLSLVSGVAAADDATTVEKSAPERSISINLDPGGVIQGYYGGNAEWLHGSHGVLVEASYFRKGDDASSISGFGGTLGYRWHWRGQMNSGFLGVNASFGVGSASTETMDSAGMKSTWDLSVRTIAVTGNVGKRWQLDNGLNITARIGAGWASRTATTESADPTAKQAAKDVEDLLAFLPVAFDGELSLGYSF